MVTSLPNSIQNTTSPKAFLTHFNYAFITVFCIEHFDEGFLLIKGKYANCHRQSNLRVGRFQICMNMNDCYAAETLDVD